jgi:hypothetical protein
MLAYLTVGDIAQWVVSVSGPMPPTCAWQQVGGSKAPAVKPMQSSRPPVPKTKFFLEIVSIALLVNER